MNELRDKPEACYESGCPLATKGKRFVLGAGDPTTAKFGLLLEGPGNDEVTFRLRAEPGRKFYETQEACDKELALRRRDYPEIPERFLRLGVCVVGRSGSELVQWGFPAAGLSRADFFIDNTLRCLPPKVGDSHYPTGNERKRAEACCRQYDRWHLFQPDITVVSLHPAAIVREPTPLWLQIKNFLKAKDFVAQGYKVIVLAGGKAAKWWLGYGENVTKWQGHYEFNDLLAQARRDSRIQDYGGVSLEPKARGVKAAKVTPERKGRKKFVWSPSDILGITEGQ